MEDKVHQPPLHHRGSRTYWRRQLLEAPRQAWERGEAKKKVCLDEIFRWKPLMALRRWDAQRMRQEQQLQKLRARQEKKSLDQSKSKSDLNCQRTSLLPALEAATAICVEEAIPVSIFGRPLPDTGAEDFSLPWLWRETQSVTGILAVTIMQQNIDDHWPVLLLGEQSCRSQVMARHHHQRELISNSDQICKLQCNVITRGALWQCHSMAPKCSDVALHGFKETISTWFIQTM